MADTATVVERIDTRLADSDRNVLLAAREEIIRLHEMLKVRGKLLADIFNSDEAVGLPGAIKDRIDACLRGKV